MIAASLMCADALETGADLRALEQAGIEYLHIDVMDGHFVPNIAMGIDLVKQIRAATEIPLDVHLMVTEPDFWVPKSLDELSPAILVFHQEAAAHGVRLAQAIRERGVLAGVAINPGTPVSALEAMLPEVDLVLVMTVNPGYAGQRIVESALAKVGQLRQIREREGYDLLIQVDGNVTLESAPRMAALGADILVGGSSLFRKDPGIVATARRIRESCAATDRG
jgi:ribulose-phosphate 3-epimerase